MPIATWNTDPTTGAGPAPAAADAAPFPPAVGLPQPGGPEPGFPLALRNAGRILAAVTGVVAGGAMLVIGGLYALLTSCVDPGGGPAGCGSLSGLVGPLELVAVLGGAAAAIAGGVGTAVTSRARWIAGGMTITIALVLLLTVLVGMQEPALH